MKIFCQHPILQEQPNRQFGQLYFLPSQRFPKFSNKTLLPFPISYYCVLGRNQIGFQFGNHLNVAAYRQLQQQYLEVNFRMTVVHKLKKLVRQIDFFYSTEMLRYENDNQYKTMTGGMVSIAIIITILIGFASLILNTLALNTFTISTETIKNVVPTRSVIQINEQSSFRFAVQIWRQNITQVKRYFDVSFRVQSTLYGVTTNVSYFQLEPCSKQFFHDYPQLLKSYDRLQVSSWLCPTYGTVLDLQGKYSSENYNNYIIQVSKCTNASDPLRPCASPQQIQDYFTSNSNFFYFTFYFTNTQINPDKKNYKQYYLEDQAYAMFGSQLGTETFLYFTDYTVQTDYSIWPFTDIVTDTGVYAEDLGINHPFQNNINGIYITWNLAKATNSIVYTREVQKLSMVFSFVGGMVGAVSAVFFIIKTYNNVSFQFSIAFQIFKPRRQDPKIAISNDKNFEENLPESSPQNFPENNEKEKEQIKDEAKEDQPPKREKVKNLSMNLVTFMKFYAYKALDFFQYQYDSPEIKYAQQCKAQILKQLDIKNLLKRIIFIEHCLTKILDDYHLDILQLKKPQTPEQVRQIRLKCQSVIDNQLESSQNSQAQQIISIRKQPTTHEHFLQTPNATIYNEQSNYVSHNQLRNTTKRFKNQQLACDLKNEIFIIDVEEIRDDNLESIDVKSNKLGTFDKKHELFQHRKLKKQESHLMKLLATAEGGNEISSQIWRNLDKETRRSKREKKQIVLPIEQA